MVSVVTHHRRVLPSAMFVSKVFFIHLGVINLDCPARFRKVVIPNCRLLF